MRNVMSKQDFVEPEDDGLADILIGKYADEFKAAQLTEGKQNRADAVNVVKAKIKEEMIPILKLKTRSARKLWSSTLQAESNVIRQLIIEGTRPDGRSHDELRNIECYVDVLPRVHGSAVFQRGETQALVTVTLGTSKDEQRVDGGITDNYSKKFMLDYNFPYSVGEVAKPRTMDVVKSVMECWLNVV